MGPAEKFIIGIIVILFALTGVATLFAVVRFGPNGTPLLSIREPYLRKLFTFLLLEVLTIALSIAYISVSRLDEATSAVQEVTSELRASAAEWDDISKSWLNEPSGITNSNLQGYQDKQGPFGLAVDDEEPNIFVLEAVDHQLRVRRTISIMNEDPDDFEAITWDQSEWYFAVTSHRQLEPEGAQSRKLLRFKIDPRKWVDIDYKITAQGRDLSEKLENYLALHQIALDRKIWVTRSPAVDQWHPWAIEIEGLTIRHGQLLIGLKWPLSADHRALILVYDWNKDEFIGYQELNLNSMGISDLAYDGQKDLLIVAANPPEKDRDHNDEDERLYLGESTVHVFHWPSSESSPKRISKVAALARTKSKLEGITLVGNELWLAYDKPNYALMRRPITELDLGS